jgi:parallel beta-helix repeat protein
MAAGIVISDREVDLAADPRAIYGSDGYWVVSQPLLSRLRPPHDNVLAWNYVAGNLSSGIYLDGGVRNVIVGNTVQDNAKEGVCFDNGSAGNVLVSNSIRSNGDRWGQSDAVLALDYADAAGRLPDGTAAQKVPGVSLDNAVYNLVFANEVSFNYGGGIKIVRTGFFNLIGMNTILKNNEGASPLFHFFGIELGATPGDSSSDELDFTPSSGNLVFSNVIRGDHYSGIFFDTGSDQNDVLDNVILDATQWGLEAVQPSTNLTLNNLTNLPSRNIGPGLDPALLGIGVPKSP